MEFKHSSRFEHDSGCIERMIRRFAIVRKNLLFSASLDVAKASSILFSLYLTARINSKVPFSVIAEILSRLRKVKTPEYYEELTDLLLSPGRFDSIQGGAPEASTGF